MGINHCGLDALVSQQVLYLPDVNSALEQVCRKAVAERMDRDMLYDTRFFNGICDSGLDNVFTYMVASDFVASGVNR